MVREERASLSNTGVLVIMEMISRNDNRSVFIDKPCLMMADDDGIDEWIDDNRRQVCVQSSATYQCVINAIHQSHVEKCLS